MDKELKQAFEHIHKSRNTFPLSIKKLKTFLYRSMALESLEIELKGNYEKVIKELAKSFGDETKIYDLYLEHKVKEYEPRIKELKEVRENYEEIKKAMEHINVEENEVYLRLGKAYYDLFNEYKIDKDNK